MLKWIGRIVAALFILAALPFHGLVPAVHVVELFSLRYYEMLAGADPLITAYVDAGWFPALLLFGSTLCLIGALVGVLKGERWAARLIMLAAIFDALSLYFANTMGYTRLDFSIGQIVMLGLGMVVLWLVTRAVTSDD